MPKRLIDSSFLDSPSMEVLSAGAQDAFPRFILLADDFGCFEVNADRLRANGWSKRPEVDQDDVMGWLYEYGTRRAPGCPPVAMFWAVAGRRYCYLTGWFGERGQRKRVEYDATTEAGRKGSKRRTPPPPADLVAAVLSGEVRADGFPPGSDVFPPGFAPGSQTGNPNNSTPAREMAGNSVSRSDPAHAVPVPVPFAVPGAVVRPADRIPTKDEKRDGDHPRTAALLATLSASGCYIGHAAELPTRASVEAALETAPAGAHSRVLAAWGLTKKPTIGWYLDAITGQPSGKARPADPRAPAAPSTDWTDTRAPWEIPT